MRQLERLDSFVNIRFPSWNRIRKFTPYPWEPASCHHNQPHLPAGQPGELLANNPLQPSGGNVLLDGTSIRRRRLNGVVRLLLKLNGHNMNTPDEIKLAEERQIEYELNELGIQYDALSSKLDPAGTVVIEVTINGRTASGTSRLFLDAINETANGNMSITDAFEIQNMYAPPI
jgi:hypothetical protein